MTIEQVGRTSGRFIEGVSPDIADQITEAIVATIKQTPSGTHGKCTGKNFVSKAGQPGMGYYARKDISTVKRNYLTHLQFR